MKTYTSNFENMDRIITEDKVTVSVFFPRLSAL